MYLVPFLRCNVKRTDYGDVESADCKSPNIVKTLAQNADSIKDGGKDAVNR